MGKFTNGLMVAVAISAASADVVATEKYPTRPIRMIIPSGAGGITDILGRIIATRLTDGVGQQVVVDNRPGASGIVGSQIVAKATPDGYTLLMVFPSHAVNPSLFVSMPYDTVRDFAPITLVSQVSPVLIVNSQFPAQSVRDLIALAKEKPGQLNHGSVGIGSMGHLAAVLLRSMAGIDFTLVTYKGSPQILSAVLSGEIQFYFIGSAGTVVPHVKAGRIRALGVGATHRIAALPDVPPVADTLPGYEARGWNGILAPAGTQRDIIDRLNREITKIVHSTDFSRVMTAQGATSVGNSPAEFDAVIRTDVAKWAKIIKEAGIRAQ